MPVTRTPKGWKAYPGSPATLATKKAAEKQARAIAISKARKAGHHIPKKGK